MLINTNDEMNEEKKQVKRSCYYQGWKVKKINMFKNSTIKT